MSKYKVGDELIIVNDPNEERQKLKDMTKLVVDGEYAEISWGIKIISVDYDKPYITLTYRNVDGKLNKVFAECLDVDNFDTEMVLEKALLKAFQNEKINISVSKNTFKIEK